MGIDTKFMSKCLKWPYLDKTIYIIDHSVRIIISCERAKIIEEYVNDDTVETVPYGYFFHDPETDRREIYLCVDRMSSENIIPLLTHEISHLMFYEFRSFIPEGGSRLMELLGYVSQRSSHAATCIWNRHQPNSTTQVADSDA